MSYGWLTESALLPSKKKQIDVESKTFIDLKVNLVKEKEKLMLRADTANLNKDFISNNPVKSKIKFKNNQKQTEVHDTHKTSKKEENLDEQNYKEKLKNYDKIKEHLIKKQNIYEKLNASGRNNIFEIDDKDLDYIKESSLIDFEMKRIENKKYFNKSAEESNLNINTDLEIQTSKERTGVKQSYDRILTEDEKQALEKIKEEEKDYKKKLEFLKRKKNIEREERIERIKKMKIDE